MEVSKAEKKKRARKSKTYTILKQIDDTTFKVVGRAEGRNAKHIARLVRAGTINLEPGDYFLVSRFSKLPEIAWIPYRRKFK